MGDKIKHPSDCATCAPGSPALPHAASNAAAERAAAERERVAFLHAKCADIGEALASAIDERDEARADLDALARAVAQALMVPTLTDREELVDPSDHAIVGAMLGLRNARDTALARLAKVEAERDEARVAPRPNPIAPAERALVEGSVERDVFLVLVRELYAAELSREHGVVRACPPFDWYDPGMRGAQFGRLADFARDAAVAFRSRWEAP